MSEGFLKIRNRVRWTDGALRGGRGRPEVTVYRISALNSKPFGCYHCRSVADAGCSFRRRRGAGAVSEVGRKLPSVAEGVVDVCGAS